MKRLLLIVSVLLSAQAYADTDCSSGKTQLDMNGCAAEKMVSADTLMNQLYKEQMAYLKDARYKNLLRNSQRAWLKYRDSACNYLTGPAEDQGSLSRYYWAACVEDLTKERVELLEGYIACRENGCPE